MTSRKLNSSSPSRFHKVRLNMRLRNGTKINLDGKVEREKEVKTEYVEVIENCDLCSLKFEDLLALISHVKWEHLTVVKMYLDVLQGRLGEKDHSQEKPSEEQKDKIS